MVNGRLQPKRTALAVPVLIMLVGALGFAAGAGRARQTPASTPPSTPKVKAQTPPGSPKLIRNLTPLRGSRRSFRRAPARARRPEPGWTTATRIASGAPASPINRQSTARGSGQPSRGAPASAVKVESPQTTTPSTLSTAAGRRDPFKPWGAPSPASQLAAGGVPGTLPAGIRGLVISELRLEGIVHLGAANDMIAVVTNYTKRAYFLRVNDTVYNGVVSKITPEAVDFKENTLDSEGRVATHEVKVKLGSAPGEGR